MAQKKERLYFLPALLVVAQSDGSPVTYLVLSMRLAGLGGDRACRACLAELQRESYVRIERATSKGDQREKVVSLTAEGWTMLRRLSQVVQDTCRPSSKDELDGRFAQA